MSVGFRAVQWNRDKLVYDGILLAAVAIYGLSEFQLSRTPEVPDVSVAAATDSGAIERGGHLALTRGCTGCHGEDFGGRLLIDVPAFAVIPASNLTEGRGGLPTGYDGRDWERAIRHGVGRDGRLLALMPSDAYFGWGEADLAALIDKGLQHTRGSYRALLTTFGLPTSDYKRFHAFLYQQNCNLPVGPYRSAKAAIRGGTSRGDSNYSSGLAS